MSIMVQAQSTDVSLLGTSQLITVTVIPSIVDSTTLLPQSQDYTFTVTFTDVCVLDSISLAPLSDQSYILMEGPKTIATMSVIFDPPLCSEPLSYSYTVTIADQNIIDSITIMGDELIMET